MRIETTVLNHTIVMPSKLETEDFSIFYGFSRSILDDYSSIFHALSFFPHDFMEIYANCEAYIGIKSAFASLSISLIRKDLLIKEMLDFIPAFNVIWSSKDTYKKSNAIVSKCKVRPIHISTKKADNCTFIEDLNDETLLNNLLIDLAKRSLENNTNKELSKFIMPYLGKSPVKRDCGNFEFPVYTHNCTTPLLHTLRSYGYYIEKTEPMPIGEGNKLHVAEIKKLTDKIDEINASVELPDWMIKNDAVLFCPSIYAPLFNVKHKLWKDIFRQLGKEGREFLKNALIRNQGYGNSTMHAKDVSNPYNPYADPMVNVLLMERQKELHLFTSIISIISTNQFAPAIRLPNSLMLHHGKLKEIATIITNSTKNRLHKLNKKLISYNQSLIDNLGDDLIDLSFRKRKKIFAICDFPIEWLSLDGVPLMFTHEISRIGSTPGNLFADLILRGQRIQFTSKLFSKILVLKSFKHDDPVNNILTKALDSHKKDGLFKNLELTIKDINSEEELINALNSFDGAFTVFDCHGNHGGHDGHAWLQIGNDRIDIWTLAGKCRIPPIIILSACNTHPIDGSHASVANGFLRCGALSVIGTHAPVQAEHAAIFVARLLHRSSEFIPLAAKHRPVTWRELITQFFRMSYTTDILRGFQKKKKILTNEQYFQIHMNTSGHINQGNTKWFEMLINSVSLASGLSENHLQDIIKEHFQFTDTMLYSQIGRPENIIIHDERND